MKVDITVPGMGESINEGFLASWSVADGSTVIEGQALFELETDKTTIDVTAPATGTLKITVPEGSDVSINQVVGLVDTDELPVPIESESSSALARKTTESAADSSLRITPAASAAASAAALDPGALTGSGRDGMITKGDVVKQIPTKADSLPDVPKSFPSTPNHSGKEHRTPLSRIRRVIAANLAKTRDELVLLTTFNEADMSAIMSLRKRYAAEFFDKHQVKLGFMSFFLKASAAALEQYPKINAHIDGDDVVYRDGIHISVAVSTPKGLITPVVRHVENRGFAEIESAIAGFSRRASEKTLLPGELIGGTFTITNGGIFGSMMSTPLPAPGQSAILGMHAITDRPAAVDGNVVIRPMMYLALSYDHRLIDGKEAVGFLTLIKKNLESPERLFLGV